MTANGNGKFSRETLIPVSLLLIAVTFTATLAMSWQARTSDIETLQRDIAKISALLDGQIQKVSNYRAQVDSYRSEDYEQRQKIAALAERIAKLE